MIAKMVNARGILTAVLLAISSVSGFALAQSTSPTSSSDTQAPDEESISKREASAIKHVNDAVEVVLGMGFEPKMNRLLQKAKGVFIVPTYGRAAFGLGGLGGAGVLLLRRDDGTWSDPVFYNIGGINIGFQIGVEGGAIAMVLNNDKAVSEFMHKNNFSLNDNGGLTIFSISVVDEGYLGNGDVVFWAGTKGLFGSWGTGTWVTIGVNDIRFNKKVTAAYYHQTMSAKDVVSGKVKNPQADTLKEVLAIASVGTSSGSSGERPSSGKSGGSTETTRVPDSRK